MASVFNSIPQAPEDAVFGLSAQCVADPSPNKINLVIGAYRDEDLKPWVLPVVRQVQVELASNPKENHEYLGIDGSPVRSHRKEERGKDLASEAKAALCSLLSRRLTMID